ncbi:DUF3592 domain-containing protein [Amycolatopsis sp. NPDC051045]|uniref:DUF3592 domain-containing protein n=1 Tax=Amycolatopsis sp. NPDC051045 TaxID=3156922 RepID=UPI003441F69F
MREDRTWLPPDDAVGHGPVDLAAQTRKLRVLGRRALVLMVLWLVVAGGAFAGLIAFERPSGELLRDGVRVTGKVLQAVDRPRKIHFSYAVQGDLRFATIAVNSGRRYAEGGPVTVIYDPANPARVRTLLEDGVDRRASAAWWLLAFCVLMAAAFSMVASIRWRRRHRAVLRTGWRPAAVTVQPDRPIRTGRHLPDILVEYRDGSRAELRASTSSHGSTPLRHQPGRPAWVGGSGQDMVVLFPTGRWLRRPYAVPAFGQKPRTGPS